MTRDDDDHIYRYIDTTVRLQGELTRTLIAPLVAGQTELRAEVFGTPDKKPLRTLIREHGHDGMIRLTRKDIVAFAAIAASIATVAGFVLSMVPHG